MWSAEMRCRRFSRDTPHYGFADRNERVAVCMHDDKIGSLTRQRRFHADPVANTPKKPRNCGSGDHPPTAEWAVYSSAPVLVAGWLARFDQ
jgi:hypothetical protein